MTRVQSAGRVWAARTPPRIHPAYQGWTSPPLPPPPPPPALRTTRTPAITRKSSAHIIIIIFIIWAGDWSVTVEAALILLITTNTHNPRQNKTLLPLQTAFPCWPSERSFLKVWTHTWHAFNPQEAWGRGCYAALTGSEDTPSWTVLEADFVSLQRDAVKYNLWFYILWFWFYW